MAPLFYLFPLGEPRPVWAGSSLFKGLSMSHTKTKFSLKNNIAFAVAVAAAGFKLTDNKAVNTDDGSCWRATLNHGRNKIVTVSNGGHGGPDHSLFHAKSEEGKKAAQASLNELFAINEVTAAVRQHLMFYLQMDLEHRDLPQAEFEKLKAAIMSEVPEPTETAVEFLVGRIADVGGTVDKLKRAAKKKLLVVFQGDDEKGQYMTYNLEDSPESRARVLAHAAKPVDYFVSDLLSVGMQSKGV